MTLILSILSNIELCMIAFIQTAHAAGEPTGVAMFSQLLLPIAFFAIFYFLIIRPQSKRNKEHKQMIDNLKVGSEVIFAGGLMGKVLSIDGDYAVIALNAKNNVMVQKASVISVLPNGTIDNVSTGA